MPRTKRGAQVKLLLALVGCSALFPPSTTAAQYWIAPPNTPGCTDSTTNNSQTNPLCFTTASVQDIIQNNPKGGDVVHLIFKPGLYEMGVLYLNGGPNRTLIFEAEDANDPPVLRFKVPTTGSPFAGPKNETWLLFGTEHLAEFQANNLVLDGNWPAWAAANTYASPANSFVQDARERGFKLGALRAKARKGTIKGVRILNCGALGVTPWHWWVSTGTECFPLYVEITEYPQGATNVWTIEDCEVRDFHSVHGGYCTAIMVTVPPGSTTSESSRVATVQRCQVYGNNLEIGLGTAKSAGIVFRDNVVVGVDRGFSCDSAPIGNVDLTNNVFLDVNLLANIGGPFWGQDGNGKWMFNNFTLAHNAVRLESVPLYQNYRSYEWQAVTYGSFTNWMPVSSAQLAVGRWATGFCAGLLVGGANQIRFETNRFTTRRLHDRFFEPDPTNTAQAKWRPFWAPAYNPVIGRECYHGTYTVSNLLASSHAMDFLNCATITDPQAERYAHDLLQVADFYPAGRVERVRPEYNGSGQLNGVWVIQVTSPLVLGDYRIWLRARYVKHHPTTNSIAVSQANLRLWVRTGPHATVTNVVPSWTNGVAWFSYEIDPWAQGRDEIVIEAYDAVESARTVVEYFHGQTVRFERIADVADDRRLIPGLLRLWRSAAGGTLTVKMAAITNTANNLRLATPGSSGDCQLYTNHVTSTNTWYYKPPEADGSWNLVFPDGRREILVRVVPVSTRNNRHWIESEMTVFQLQAPTNTYAVAPPAPWTTPGPTNHSVAVTLWDGAKYWMYDMGGYYYFDCGGENQPAGMEKEAFEPVLTEGEESSLTNGEELVEPADEEVPAPDAAPAGWVLTRTGEWIAAETGEAAAMKDSDVPLSEEAPVGAEALEGEVGLNSTTCYLYGYGNAAYGINTQSDTNDLPVPVIAGSAFFNNSRYPLLPQPYFQLAGSWQWPDLMYGFRPVSTPWQLFGLLRDVNNSNNLVGVIDSRACYVVGTNVYYLKPYKPTEIYSEAFALSDGGYAAGRGRSNNVYRATLWDVLDLNAPPVDLDPNNPTRPGYAYGVNSSGVTVGKVQRTQNNHYVWRAFRWNGTLTELALPGDTNVTLYHNTANDVTASGHAVGASDAVILRVGYGRETRAAVWWAGSNAPVLLGTVGWTDPNPARRPGRSEALGATETVPNTLWVVGTGWITPTGFSRAYRQSVTRESANKPWNYAVLLDLNDPMCSVIPSGWTLVTAEDVNSSVWIVGTGVDGLGQGRGYVLVSQLPVP